MAHTAFVERVPKVHLFVDQKGRTQRHTKKLVDNVLCASNHGNRGLKTTTDRDKVTCKRCMAQMNIDPRVELQEMLNDSHVEYNHLLEQKEKLERQVERLERTLRFVMTAVDEDAMHQVVHVATMTTIGDLVRLALGD